MSEQFSVKVWDLPTRVFHWSLLLAVFGSFYSVWVAEDMVLHSRFGYAVLALCLFRLVWGVVGGHWSRFASFVPSWGQTRAYVSSKQPLAAQPGHNPLGAWSVYAFLLLLLLQVASGLGSDDDVLFSGPLTPLMSSEWVSWFTLYHAEVGKTVLLVLILVHIAAVLFYTLVKRQALIQTMWHGVRQWPVAAKPSTDNWRSRLLALGLLGVIAASLYLALGLLPV